MPEILLFKNMPEQRTYHMDGTIEKQNSMLGQPKSSELDNNNNKKHKQKCKISRNKKINFSKNFVLNENE